VVVYRYRTNSTPRVLHRAANRWPGRVVGHRSVPV